MKTRLIYLLSGLSALVMSACVKHNFADGSLSPIIAVSDLRTIYKGADVTLTSSNMLGAHQIVGLVISNPDSGNVPQNIIVLQNNRRSAIRGIAIPLTTGAANYHMGDSLMVEVEGGVLKRINGSLQLTGITAGNITKISSNNAVSVVSTSSYSIKKTPNAYENTLVQIKSATVSPQPLPTSTYTGDRYLVNGADSIIMHTEATANYANQKLPATATVAGILFVNQDGNGNPLYQVWPRMGADITEKVAPTDPNAPPLGKNPVIICGYITDPKGADGNYEFFQFKATQNIDFSITPMSVVTCTNAGTAAPDAGTAPGGGWAEGGGRTYKFNLTSGTVKKGDFFYVGGSNKKLDGPNSTDISSANWIRTIAYVTTDGDGFGSASSGLLPDSGNGGGIAIFGGTSVTATSVPIDLVFFGGTGVTTIYNAASNKGYLVPDNDHYHPIDPVSKAVQPYLYQGTNTYVVPHSTPTDAGIYVKLGGVFDATNKIWITPRSYSFLTLTITTPLSSIEIGSDVTSIQ